VPQSPYLQGGPKNDLSSLIQQVLVWYRLKSSPKSGSWAQPCINSPNPRLPDRVKHKQPPSMTSGVVSSCSKARSEPNLKDTASHFEIQFVTTQTVRKRS
jgi:hypothetical protein